MNWRRDSTWVDDLGPGAFAVALALPGTVARASRVINVRRAAKRHHPTTAEPARVAKGGHLWSPPRHLSPISCHAGGELSPPLPASIGPEEDVRTSVPDVVASADRLSGGRPNPADQSQGDRSRCECGSVGQAHHA